MTRPFEGEEPSFSEPSPAAEQLGYEPATVRSGVKIEQSAKGVAQVKVSAYSGETEEEMQRLKDLAVNTYLATLRELEHRTGLGH